MSTKTKLIIVDDVLMVRLGLSQMLRKVDTIEIIAEADNGQAFLDKLSIYKPDVVLMDIKMPIMDGLEATKKALNKYPGLKIIALTADSNESAIEEMVLSGAKGFLLKSVGIAELQKAIETVLGGSTYYSNELVTAFKLKK
jgi:two-component system, NarL family, response regulator LiaR